MIKLLQGYCKKSEFLAVLQQSVTPLDKHVAMYRITVLTEATPYEFDNEHIYINGGVIWMTKQNGSFFKAPKFNLRFESL